MRRFSTREKTFGTAEHTLRSARFLPYACLAASLLGAAGSLAGQEPPAPPDTALVTVEGEVLDRATSLPVEAAVIFLTEIGWTTFTDELGYFRFDEVPPGLHSVTTVRVGYQALDAQVPVDGQELLALYLTPEPISLEGIEVEVFGAEALERRASGTSMAGVIGPVEMDELRERYFSLDQILISRHVPRARYVPPRFPGTQGCLRVTSLGLRRRACAAVVVDGVLLHPSTAGWVYDMSPHDIFAVRFLHGAAAALRYGHQGADGVLMIETRRGR